MLPNLLIIGAMNCGTTSLHYYLNLHPEISMTKEKELDFFIKEINYKLGVDWYESHFNNMNTKIRGESSPSYTKYPKFKGVPQRIYRLIPNAKLIYVVRHPIQRIISHYNHNFSKGREYRSLDDALSKLQNNSYILYSKYYTQLKIYFRYFEKDKILILDSEDLYINRLDTLKKIFRFLEVNETYNHEEFNMILHRSRDKKIDNKLSEYTSKVPVLEKTKKIFPESLYRLIFQKNIIIKDLNNRIKMKILNYLEKDIDCLRKISGLELKNWDL